MHAFETRIRNQCARPHVSAEGVACEQICDRFGDHLLQCPSGGGFFIGHDIVCAEVADLAREYEGNPGAAVDWKPKVDAWPRSTREYEADVGLYYFPVLKISTSTA